LILAALLAAALQDAALPEGNTFVRALLERQRQDEDLLDRYTYDLTRTREELRADGTVKSRRTLRFEIFHVKGRPVRRLVADDGRPLPAARQAKEDRRVRAMVEAIRAGRVAVEEPNRRLSRLLEDFDFRSVGREERGGRITLVIDFAPRPNTEPRPGSASVRRSEDESIRNLSGHLWADERQGRIVKVEVHNDVPLRVGLGVGVSVSALAFSAEFRRVDDAVWLPHQVETGATGRVMLVKGFRVRHIDEYGNYRRFEVDSEEQIRPRE
jgi:hypothetical protein